MLTKRFIYTQVLIYIMARPNKFKQGMKVKSVLNKYEEYEVLEVLKNELKVCPIGQNVFFTCKKSIFEEVE